ncbi:hypothetical protein [Streptomyces sp. NPDC007883]
MSTRNGRGAEVGQVAVVMAVIAGVLLLTLMAFILRFLNSSLWSTGVSAL